MKIVKRFCLVLFTIMILSCDKTMELNQLDFEVILQEERVKAGEEVAFDLTGQANIVTFYSGEIGNEYEFKEGRPLVLSDPQVSFSSDAWYGTQEGQISILVSSKFSGDYSVESLKNSVESGEWIDITEKFDIRENTGVRQTVPSGIFDLSEMITDDETGIYFAYRNEVKPDAESAPVTQWTMSRFLLTANTMLGRRTLVDHSSADWKVVMAKDIDVKDPLIQANNVFFRRNDNRKLNLDNWAITKKIEFDAINLGPDLAQPIKSYSDPQLEEFRYVYEVPGTYIATFVASNVNTKDEVSVVKQVKVVVSP